MKTFKHTETSSESYGEYLYTHHLDSVIVSILSYFLIYMSVIYTYNFFWIIFKL